MTARFEPVAPFDPAAIPSRQSALIARTMRGSLRPVTRAATIGRVHVGAARATFDTVMGRLCYPPRGTVHTPQPAEHQGHVVPGELVRGPLVGDRRDAVVLYMHGSGFVFCSLGSHRGLVARVSEVTGVPVFSLDYRLAPEHRFPAAHDDVLAAYRWLLDQGYEPQRIVVAGDSAGAHLSVALAVELRRLRLPQPGLLVLLSPYLDPSWELAFARDRQSPDPFFVPEAGRRCVNLYFAGADLTDPRIDLINTDPAGLPPMLLQVGGSECMSAAAEVFAARVNEAGGTCELQVWPGQIHVFQAMFRLVPEANLALGHIGHVVRSALTDTIEPLAPRRAA